MRSFSAPRTDYTPHCSDHHQVSPQSSSFVTLYIENGAQYITIFGNYAHYNSDYSVLHISANAD